MARRGNRLIPARAVPPGAVVRGELEARGWTQEDLARIMGRPAQVISEIISGKKQITPETALGLAGAFGTSPEMWLNMEAAYRLSLARRDSGDDSVERRSRVYSLVPVKELVKRGWIEESADVADLEGRVASFLGTSSLDEELHLKLAARRTPTREPDPRGVLVWMRRVEQLASAQEAPAFRRAVLKEAINDLLRLAQEPARVREVPGFLRRYGVRFVIVPHLPKTYLDGGVFSENGHPIVALTLRYDRLDSFWFTLLHELAHLVAGHKGNRPEDLDAEAGTDPEEREADRLAADWLVPTDALVAFAARVKPYFSRRAIQSFARSIGRHQAIVLGRLQHDQYVSPAHLRSSIPKIRHKLEPWIDVPEPVPHTPVEAAVVGEPTPPYDPAGAVLGWLRDNPGWHSPAEIRQALSLDPTSWTRTVHSLFSAGKVQRKGEKRGTKYRSAENASR